MILKRGNLYYWQKRLVVEFGGWENGKYIFNTTNGGKITLSQEQVQAQISKDE